MSYLRLFWRLLRLSLALLIGICFCTTLSLLERISTRDWMPLKQRMTCWFMRSLRAALPFKVSVSGALPQQPMLWVSNHISWTDIPMLGALMPMSFLSKDEVRHWPVAGWLASTAGTLFIRRGSGDSGQISDQLSQHLRQARNLLIFPEGTTTDGLAVRTFHGRLLSGAIDAGVAIQPVAIRYLRGGKPCALAPYIGDDSLGSHLVRLFKAPAAEVQITLLSPIASDSGNRNALARRCQHTIAEAMQLPSPAAYVRANEQMALND